MRTEFRADRETLRHELGAEIAAAHLETRRHIDVINEATRHEIGVLAEAIGSVRDDLRRTETRLDQKIDRTAIETQALIRYSHSELDRRLQALE